MVRIPARSTPTPTEFGEVPLTREEIADRIAGYQARVSGRVLALTRFLVRTPAGTERLHTVTEPLLARATPTDAVRVDWLGNGVGQHVFPVEPVEPHSALGPNPTVFGVGQAVDRYGYALGDAPHSAPLRVRLRHRIR